MLDSFHRKYKTQNLFFHPPYLPLKCSEVKVAQLCPTLCVPMDYTVRGILQARILEWAAFAFSSDLPNPGIEPRCPTLQADSLPAEPQTYLLAICLSPPPYHHFGRMFHIPAPTSYILLLPQPLDSGFTY